MALDLGTLRARVKVDDSDVDTGLARTKGRLRRFAASAAADLGRQGQGMGSKLGGGLHSGVSRAVGGIGKVLGAGALGLVGFGVAGAAALGAIGAAAGIYGVKVASGNEQAKISFETMLGSATKADKFLKDLQQFAATTPFEFPELQTAASSLISAGVQADKVIPIMRTLGDVTSGMGTGAEGVRRATVALQQMQAAGRITGEDLNQLRDAGIPVYDLLAKATGKSKEEVVKLAAAGKLGKKELDQLMRALESGKGLERFNGLMEKQSKSLAGLASTYKDVVGQGLARIADRAFPMLKAGLNDLVGVTERAFKWFDRNGDAISSVFTVGGRVLRSFGRIAGRVLGIFVKDITGSTGSFKDFAAFLEDHEADLVGLFVRLGKGAIEFGISTAQVISAVVRGFGWLSVGVGGVVAGIITYYEMIVVAAAKAFGWIPGIGPKLEAAAEKFKAFGAKARSGIDDTKKDADKFADGIDNKLIPSLRKAGQGMEDMGKKEVAKAEQREAASRLARAINDIGTRADGSQIKLKRWSDRTKLAAGEQRSLNDRISTARQKLRDHLAAIEANGGGQKKLTAAWEKGRDRLEKEFRQMGLSEKQAKKLAERYAGIKPKVETKVTQPGMTGALGDTDKLKTRINHLSGKKVKISFATNAKDAARALGISVANYNNVGGRLGSILASQVGAASVGTGHGHAEGGPTQHAPITLSTDTMSRNVPRFTGDTPGAITKMATTAGKGLQAKGLAQLTKDQARVQASAADQAPGKNINVAAGWSAIYATARRHGASHFGTYPGHHPSMARARDITPHSWAMANALKALSSVWYVIYKRKITSKSPGRGNVWRNYTPTNTTGDFWHDRHIHVARYDWGGRLREGAAAYNWRGGIERVLTSAQNRAFETLVDRLTVNPQLAHLNDGRGYSAAETRRRRGGRTLIEGGVQFVSSGKPRDDVGELLFALRTLDQGGPHA